MRKQCILLYYKLLTNERAVYHLTRLFLCQLPSPSNTALYITFSYKGEQVTCLE